MRLAKQVHLHWNAIYCKIKPFSGHNIVFSTTWEEMHADWAWNSVGFDKQSLETSN